MNRNWPSWPRVALIFTSMLLLVTVGFCWSKVGLASRLATGNELITEQQAVQIAEAYIDEKGYTDALPRFHSWEEIRNTFLPGPVPLGENYFVYDCLEPKAIGFLRPREVQGWLVAFRSKPWEHGRNYDTIGHGINIDPYGKEITEANSVSIIFSKLDKRLRP